MRSLNILQVCSSRSWGGMEMHVGILCEQLQRRGHRVVALCPPDSEIERDLLARGIETMPFEPFDYLDVPAIVRTSRLLRTQRFDIIHSHYSRDLWVLAPAASLAGDVPIVFIKHIGTQKAKTDFLHRWIYRRVCKIIAISGVIADNVRRTHPVDAGRVTVIHHGLDLSQFSDHDKAREKSRREFGIGDDDILIGTIGRLQEGKGHIEFLEMAARIAAEFSQARFIIVGEATRGEEHRAEKIYRKIDQVNLGKRLVLAGFRKDIPAVLAAMDIFAFPSRAEAFGLVIIEAMAAGVPVVSTRSDGVLDIIKDGVNGILVDRQNVDQLTAAVRSLIVDAKRRKELAAAGRRTIEEKFTIDRMVAETEKVYRDCL